MVEHVRKTRQHWLFYVSGVSEYAGFQYQEHGKSLSRVGQRTAPSSHTSARHEDSVPRRHWEKSSTQNSTASFI